MAVNDYALKSIEEARAQGQSHWLLTWASSRTRARDLGTVVSTTFHDAMDVLSTHMERLIVEAESCHANLIGLEEKLSSLQAIVSREDSSISTEKSELLQHLWTKLGGNRQSIQNFDRHIELLHGLNIYRKQALIHVVSALHTLRSMSSDVEDLRERAVASDLVSSAIPVEVHMSSIQAGLERLKQGRRKAKDMEEGAVQRVLLGIDSYY